MDERELNVLAVAFQKGDERAFRLLVETLSRTLIAMAFRYARDWEWARDLTQETWIRVYQRIRRFDPERSFSAWLHVIHRNGCLDHVRRGWVRHETAPGDEILALMDRPAPEDPEKDLERKEFHDRLLVAVQDLSETQRQVFLRVDMEQNDQKEVAQALGMKFPTLRTTLHYARKRVASALLRMEGSPRMERGT